MKGYLHPPKSSLCYLALLTLDFFKLTLKDNTVSDAPKHFALKKIQPKVYVK